jgi:hypothetical protein
MDSSAAVVSVADIERARKHVNDIREELRCCMNRVEANRHAGHLLDNTVRDSFRLAQALKKSEARLKSFKTRRDEGLKIQEAAALSSMPSATATPVNLSQR